VSARVVTGNDRSAAVAGRLRYRFDGDVLVIEEGKWDFPPEVSLRGRWRRIRGERLP
jgi:hypothetical protein